MLIDWFTVGAQVLNFLILVGLLKRFLYGPIVTAIDVREKAIAAEVATAAAKKAEAGKESEEFKQKNADFDRDRVALMGKVKGESEIERHRLLDEGRKDSEMVGAKRLAAMLTEQQGLNEQLHFRVQAEVFAITRKVLADLATVSLEDRMVEVLTRKLRDMKAAAKEAFASALNGSSEPANVRSAFELAADQRVALQLALREAFSTDVRVRFETAASLVCGIEVTSGGQKIAWSIAEYLASLETSVTDLFKDQARLRDEQRAPPAGTPA